MKEIILCIGSPMWDTYIAVPEEFLSSPFGVQDEQGSGLGKGDAKEHDSYSTFMSILQAAERNKTSELVDSDCGGCIVNTAKVIGCFSQKVALIGCIGTDSTAKAVKQRLSHYGISDLTISAEAPTGEVVCLITPDAQRTFSYYAGAASKIGFDLYKEKLSSYLRAQAEVRIKIAYFDCYTLQCPSQFTEEAMLFVKAHSAMIAFNTGFKGIVSTERQRIRSIVADLCDVIITNEEEAIALSCEMSNASVADACQNVYELMKSEAAICMVTMGNKGCYFQASGMNEPQFIPVKDEYFVEKPIDTTGAGDFFAGGFLMNLSQLSYAERSSSKHLIDCIAHGQFCASKIICLNGTRFDPASFKLIDSPLR